MELSSWMLGFAKELKSQGGVDESRVLRSALEVAKAASDYWKDNQIDPVILDLNCKILVDGQEKEATVQIDLSNSGFLVLAVASLLIARS